MLTRYHIVRGARPLGDPLPEGRRIDIRKHTRHALAPEPALVEAFLEAPSDASFRRFRDAYRALLDRRFRADPKPFEALADMARREDVHLGCNCPTAKNPDVRRCHTSLALGFMKERFPELDVRMP